MKVLCLVLAVCLLGAFSGGAAPPKTDRAAKETAPAKEASPNAGPAALILSFPTAIEAMSGKKTLPLDLQNAQDAALLAEIGQCLERLLPKINADQSPRLRAGNPPPEDFTREFARAFQADCEGGKRLESRRLTAGGDGYPDLRINALGSNRICYLGVRLHPAPRPAGPATALRLDSTLVRERVDVDGAHLLIDVEYGARASGPTSFLNWELIDLAKFQFQPRPAVVFEAAPREVPPTGATLTDGRKGRD